METINLEHLDKKQLAMILTSMAAEGKIDLRDLSVLSNQAKATILEKSRSKEDYTPKEYISFDLGFTAYIYILENGGTAQEALEYAARQHDKPDGFIDKAKNLPYFYAKDVVENADEYDDMVGYELFYARSRCKRPQKAYYKHLHKDLWSLFDECGEGD